MTLKISGFSFLVAALVAVSFGALPVAASAALYPSFTVSAGNLSRGGGSGVRSFISRPLPAPEETPDTTQTPPPGENGADGAPGQNGANATTPDQATSTQAVNTNPATQGAANTGGNNGGAVAGNGGNGGAGGAGGNAQTGGTVSSGGVSANATSNNSVNAFSFFFMTRR